MYHIRIICTITKPSQFTLKTVSILYQQRETGQILLSGRTFLRRVKLLQDQQALLGGISPEDGTEGLHRLFALAVVGGETDVLHMRPELLNDFRRIFQLLGGEVGEVQDPVVLLAVFMPGAEKIHRMIEQ